MTKKFQGVDIDLVHRVVASNNKRGANQWGDPNARTDRCEELLAKPMTTAELMTASGYCESAIKRYIALLHTADPKRIHICEYRKNAIVYKAGNLPDVPKPVRPKYEPKKRVDDDWPRMPVVVNVARDPLVAAFFGNETHSRIADEAIA